MSGSIPAIFDQFPGLRGSLAHVRLVDSPTPVQQLAKLSEERGEGSKSHLPARNYAVIIDEAHSSQSGETATELKGVLGGA